MANKTLPVKQKFDRYLIYIVIFSLLSSGKIWLLKDAFWDDNCWLLSVFASRNLDDYLSTGWYELRRAPFGTFLYYLFSLHKNTEYFYFVGHSINLATQILTPVFLYLTLKNIFKPKEVFAFLSAVSFIVFSLDYSLPYFSAVNYRIGILLTIISFYLTERGLVKDNPRWSFLLTALALSGFSHYVLIEGTVIFEPARLFIISYIFYKKGYKGKFLTEKILKYGSLFLLICIPLAVYKLLYKPYGIYNGMYKIDMYFFLNWHEHKKALGMLLFEQWKIIYKITKHIGLWTSLASVFSGVTAFLLLRRLPAKLINELENTEKTLFKKIRQFLIPAFLLGLILLILPLSLLEFSAREIGPGLNSSHFALLQLGYAIILGCIIYILYISFIVLKFNFRVLNFFLALVMAFGIFFNNLNLDLYFKGWEKQKQFWREFTNRFPSLPEKAVFLMDARDFYYNDIADLDNTYDLEYIINLLYARTDNPEKFREYRVVAMEEFSPEMSKIKCDNLKETAIKRVTHFGKETLNPCEFIVIHYRNNELLVNSEIIKRYPNIPYKNLADKDYPRLPEPKIYSLRYKLKGFANN